MAILGPKPWVNPFGKMSIFKKFWTSCFYSLQRRFFVVQYRKRLFPNINYLKKEIGKMDKFGPKPWANPFKKNFNFSTFWTSSFYSLDRRFFVLEYRKSHFPGQYCLKKRLEKWTYLDQNHLFTPFGKIGRASCRERV